MSNNLKRKIKRKKYLEERKVSEKELASKMKNIFLPDQCSNCEKPFDKKSREMAMTWRVVAREERKHLICPTCWGLIERIDPLREERERKLRLRQAQSHTEQGQETQLNPQNEA